MTMEQKIKEIMAIAGAEAGAIAARKPWRFLDGLLDGLRDRGAEAMPALLERRGSFSGAPAVGDIELSEIPF